ncbi:hypothetical protein DFP72DRAFT_333236 [Ephemerocybe angulata]|uniref:Uncharacterized protein n=1 Tax=Ephemerocybe angulata TaxID=980116 RepID=A0A8H6IGN7_9AGAR|nr:hypothetical protein DFP72DRAFT_333236 [Tulosesus angulatus]
MLATKMRQSFLDPKSSPTSNAASSPTPFSIDLTKPTMLPCLPLQQVASISNASPGHSSEATGGPQLLLSSIQRPLSPPHPRDMTSSLRSNKVSDKHTEEKATLAVPQSANEIPENQVYGIPMHPHSYLFPSQPTAMQMSQEALRNSFVARVSPASTLPQLLPDEVETPSGSRRGSKVVQDPKVAPTSHTPGHDYTPAYTSSQGHGQVRHRRSHSDSYGRGLDTASRQASDDRLQQTLAPHLYLNNGVDGHLQGHSPRSSPLVNQPQIAPPDQGTKRELKHHSGPPLARSAFANVAQVERRDLINGDAQEGIATHGLVKPSFGLQDVASSGTSMADSSPSISGDRRGQDDPRIPAVQPPNHKLYHITDPTAASQEEIRRHGENVYPEQGLNGSHGKQLLYQQSQLNVSSVSAVIPNFTDGQSLGQTASHHSSKYPSHTTHRDTVNTEPVPVEPVQVSAGLVVQTLSSGPVNRSETTSAGVSSRWTPGTRIASAPVPRTEAMQPQSRASQAIPGYMKVDPLSESRHGPRASEHTIGIAVNPAIPAKEPGGVEGSSYEPDPSNSDRENEGRVREGVQQKAAGHAHYLPKPTGDTTGKRKDFASLLHRKLSTLMSGPNEASQSQQEKPTEANTVQPSSRSFFPSNVFSSASQQARSLRHRSNHAPQGRATTEPHVVPPDGHTERHLDRPSQPTIYTGVQDLKNDGQPNPGATNAGAFHRSHRQPASTPVPPSTRPPLSRLPPIETDSTNLPDAIAKSVPPGLAAEQKYQGRTTASSSIPGHRSGTNSSGHKHSYSVPIAIAPAHVPNELSNRARHHRSMQPPSSIKHMPSTASSSRSYETIYQSQQEDETILMTPSSLAPTPLHEIPPPSHQAFTRSDEHLSEVNQTNPQMTAAERRSARARHTAWRLKELARQNDERQQPFFIPDDDDSDDERDVDPRMFSPFRYLGSRRRRTVSLLSHEAQDGTATNTAIGSPTTSILSTAPFVLPDERDPVKAAKEWRDQEEAGMKKVKKRRPRPGVVFVVKDDPNEENKPRPRRISEGGKARSGSSSSLARQAAGGSR